MITPNIQAELSQKFNKNLESFLSKPFSYDNRELLIKQKIKFPLVGYYVKKSNNIDKRQAKNPKQKQHICMFLNWQDWPRRTLKHYGYKSKLDNWLLLRCATGKEIKLISNCQRMIRLHFYRWNDILIYHLRNELGTEELIKLSQMFTLDDAPASLKIAELFAEIPMKLFSKHNQIKLL